MWKLAAYSALLSTMHTFIATDTIGLNVSEAHRVSSSDHAYLMTEQVGELVRFVSHHLPLGSQTQGTDRNLARRLLIQPFYYTNNDDKYRCSHTLAILIGKYHTEENGPSCVFGHLQIMQLF